MNFKDSLPDLFFKLAYFLTVRVARTQDKMMIGCVNIKFLFPYQAFQINQLTEMKFWFSDPTVVRPTRRTVVGKVLDFLVWPKDVWTSWNKVSQSFLLVFANCNFLLAEFFRWDRWSGSIFCIFFNWPFSAISIDEHFVKLFCNGGGIFWKR